MDDFWWERRRPYKETLMHKGKYKLEILSLTLELIIIIDDGPQTVGKVRCQQ